MSEALCILAAGKGTRLQSKLHKCLLPIADKAVLSHIIEKVPHADIIVAVGYKSQLIKEYCLAAHPNRNFTFVEVDNYDRPGSGPGYSLQSCQNRLQRPFYLFCGDCLVTDDLPPLNATWIGISPITDPTPWATAEVRRMRGDETPFVVNFKNKSPDGYPHAFIGLAGIKNYQVFWKMLDMPAADKEFELVRAFYDPAVYPLRAHSFQWFDTGTTENYTKTRAALGECTLGLTKDIDEITYKINGQCVKVFGDSEIATRRIHRATLLPGLVPKLNFTGSHVYSYSWVLGDTLYTQPGRFPEFLDWCEKSNLWKKVRVNNFPEICRKFYHDKTFERLESYLNKKGINDEKLKSRLNNLNWERLCDGIPVTFHGDLQFDNILVTKDFCLIDWRDSFAGSYYGDLYYDFAKLYAGLSMSYQKIREGKFNVVGENYFFESSDLPRKYFEGWLTGRGYDLAKVRTLAALVYLNMSPLHTPDFDKLLFLHARNQICNDSDILSASA